MKRLAAGAALLLLSLAVRADISVNTDNLHLTFDERGNLQTVIACYPMCSGENVRLQQFGDGGVIVFDTVADSPWKRSENETGTAYELRFEQSGGARLTWRIPRRGYRLELEQSGVTAIQLYSGESFRPRDAAGFGNWLEQLRYAVLDRGDVTQVALDDTDASTLPVDQWAGYRNRYWALMTAPSSEVHVRVQTGEERRDATLAFEEPPDGKWSFYAGPVEPVVLAQTDAALPGLMYASLWFWLRWICLGLFHLLAVIQSVVPSWGLAIMTMSLSVNILMLPLSRIADRFQQQVNETEARLAPELQRIKKNFRGEEQSAKILALYKTERVHPLYSLKSLVGVAVVIPVFIGAFDMLAENIHLLHSGFLWIKDLSRPDDLLNLPFRLPFFGDELNLLPFLMTGLSFVASLLHKPLALSPELRNRQVRNMILLALAFFVLFYTFPAGMVLYWTTNNLISVIKSLWALR